MKSMQSIVISSRFWENEWSTSGKLALGNAIKIFRSYSCSDGSKSSLLDCERVKKCICPHNSFVQFSSKFTRRHFAFRRRLRRQRRRIVENMPASSRFLIQECLEN